MINHFFSSGLTHKSRVSSRPASSTLWTRVVGAKNTYINTVFPAILQLSFVLCRVSSFPSEFFVPSVEFELIVCRVPVVRSPTRITY